LSSGHFVVLHVYSRLNRQLSLLTRFLLGESDGFLKQVEDHRGKKCPKESLPTLSSHPHPSSQCPITPKPGTSTNTDDSISSPKRTTVTKVNDDVDEDFTEILDNDVSPGEASS
jgi:hypothetical protein